MRRSESNAHRFRKFVAYRSNALTRIVSSTINPHPDWPLGQCLRASFGNWFVVLANFRRLLFVSPPLSAMFSILPRARSLSFPLFFFLFSFSLHSLWPSFATNCVNLPAKYLSLWPNDDLSFVSERVQRFRGSSDDSLLRCLPFSMNDLFNEQPRFRKTSLG